MRKWKLCVVAMVFVPWPVLAQDAEKAAYPRRLTGPELEAHFKNTWSADGTTSRGTRVNIYNDPGTLQLLTPNVGRASPAMSTKKVNADEGQVCLDFGTTVWRAATDCYRVVQTDAQSYSMRSVTTKFRIDYSR